MAPADLFDAHPEPARPVTVLAPGAVLLPGFALADAPALLEHLATIATEAPFRHLTTPGGATMSVAMTNSGALGWVSDRRGYRYEPTDPATGRPWPPLPPVFAGLARRAAKQAGFAGFAPEACLINRYVPGARLTLHRDADEQDFGAPIVSVSLGLPATFLFGGLARTDRVSRHRLVHGDVAVWGGPSRLAFHGIAPLKDGTHPQVGGVRYNLTFRRIS